MPYNVPRNHFLEMLNSRFTTFSLDIAACIEARTLLNVPEKQWKIFTLLVYAHITTAVLLCIFGIVCFCLGLIHSSLYTEVSCSDGVNFFLPFINAVSSFVGVIAVRALHLTWPPFVHLVTLSVAFPSLLIIAVVTYIEANIWYGQSHGTPEPIPAGVVYKNWARTFADLDVLITTVVVLNSELTSA
ncbi:hypothetical protein GCK32_011691 [Trichostrongylus colubriformis]|uniref:Uncharacterized protein n=1 Tax=Trichostrongylus colubriformis TaxID=6319 RepID=A0AAN8FW02_TRICO